MCCDICSRYDKCEEKNRLRDDCCPKCPEYGYCVGVNGDPEQEDKDRDSKRDADSGTPDTDF